MVISTQKPTFVQHHMEAMFEAGQIGDNLRRRYRPESLMVKPEDVIPLLNQAKIRFVLMGTYGINGYRDESRATQDVAFLIRSKDHEAAVKIIQVNFPELECVDTPVVTRFLDPVRKKSLIDLMKPSFDLLKDAFKHSVLVGKSHRIPTLEMAIVSKFAAMVSPNREKDKKLIDGGDFYNMVRTNRESLDLRKLKRLAERVYKGAAGEITRFVNDVLADRDLVF